MTKKLFTLCLAFGSMAFATASAQSEGTKIHFPTPANTAVKAASHQAINAQNRSVLCGVDTIVYPYLKELVFTAPADSFFVDAMVGNVRTASQAYPMSGSANIHGVQFWGGAYSTSPAPQTLVVRAYLYSVDGFNKPVAALDSADVTITQAYDYYEAIFPAPHPVTGNFAVGVKCVPNDTLAVITNNAGNSWSPAYGENLAWRRFGSGVWNSALSFFGQDLEYMIFPIVSYTNDAAFTSSASAVCEGESVFFTNTTSGLIGDRAFNLYAFDAYWGFAAADSSYTWNYGTDATWTNSINGSKTYTTAGTYTSTLNAELLGYYTSCTDAQTFSVTVNPTYAVNMGTVSICSGSSMTFGTQTLSAAGSYTEPFSTVNGCDSIVSLTLTIDTLDPNVTLSGSTITAEIADTYEWIDCNTNTPIAGANSQSYTAVAPGDYAVYLTRGACSDTSACTSITSVGIDQITSGQVAVYPNPSNGDFSVKTNGIAERLIVYNIVGAVVQDITPASSLTQISLNDEAKGVYYLSIQQKHSVKVIKLVKK